MTKLIFCRKCVLPNTRPNLVLDDDGICNACKTHDVKPNIDWDLRKRAFGELIVDAKKRSKGYDCLIPVSGGKDSTWQVIVCLEYGLKPLTVTWRPPGRTVIGQQNLDNLIRLGVDHIDFSFNPRVEAAFMLKAFERYGTPALPMHMALYNMPLMLALKFQIPLVMWGENSADEYGSSDDCSARGFQLTEEWLAKYGVTHGTTPDDWIDDQLTQVDLTPYFRPTGNQLNEAGVLGAFLGYYFPWDPQTSLDAAEKQGFKRRAEGAKTGYWDYADIDDDFISIHHFLKWYKFGFTRLFDNLSIEIRNGRLEREEAISIIVETGEQTPHEDIEAFCKFVGIDKKRFFEIVEKFRNPDIWVKIDGTWTIRDFLVSDWQWV